MATALAFLVTTLCSQVSVLLAATGPFDEGIIACANSPDQECSCRGTLNKAGAGNTNCSGPAANWPNCNTQCCASPAGGTCHQPMGTNAGKTCGPTKASNNMVLGTALSASISDADFKSTCCQDAFTCAQVTCNSQRRRDTKTTTWKAKTGVAATTCTDKDSCELACCEADPTMCYTALMEASPLKSCGPDHIAKGMTSQRRRSMSAAATLTFTDDTTFKSQCCDAKVTCTASVCTANGVVTYDAKSTMPTTKCSTLPCSLGECCDLKANACEQNCTGGHTNQGSTMVPVCDGVVNGNNSCGSNKVIDKSKVFAAGGTNDAWKTSCCIDKVTAPTSPPVVNAMCSAYWTASAAAAKKATSSGAEMAAWPSAIFAMVGLSIVMI